MNEYELIKKSKHGDKKAFCDLYDLYKDRLYRYAYYRLRNSEDAEDAVSECVMLAWKQIGALRDACAFQSWIFKILAASCNKYIKAQIAKRDVVSIDGLPVGSASNISDSTLLLREALDKLSEEEQSIVLLSTVGGLKSREIAEITGLTAGSVRSSLSRSLKKMREYLE